MTKEEIKKESLKRFPVNHKQNSQGAQYDANSPRRRAFVDGAFFALEIENKKNDNNEK